LARVGPDLTHLQSRSTFAGSSFDLTEANLKKWVENPSAMKPMRPEQGTGMPDLGLTGDEINKVVAYLSTLK
jgi:cytochrome c oxidase subunit 2